MKLQGFIQDNYTQEELASSLRIFERDIKDWITDINEEDLNELSLKILECYIDLDYNDGCVDNFRVSRVEYVEDKETCWSDRYDYAELRGCCGSCDVHFTTKSGNDYIYGFNYGH